MHRVIYIIQANASNGKPDIFYSAEIHHKYLLNKKSVKCNDRSKLDIISKKT